MELYRRICACQNFEIFIIDLLAEGDRCYLFDCRANMYVSELILRTPLASIWPADC